MHFSDAASELLSITVDGAEHTYEATVDTDGDGVNDTVAVDTADGSYEYTDTDHDGIADTLTQFDTHGHVTGQAVFDAATGHWETGHDPGASTPLLQPDAAAASAGVPTIDSDGDGVADTALGHTPDGSTVLATDTNGDGTPDVVTTISEDGDFTTYERSDDHTWHTSGHGNLAEGTPAAAPAGHAVIDPATGEWIHR